MDLLKITNIQIMNVSFLIGLGGAQALSQIYVVTKEFILYVGKYIIFSIIGYSKISLT